MKLGAVQEIAGVKAEEERCLTALARLTKPSSRDHLSIGYIQAGDAAAPGNRRSFRARYGAPLFLKSTAQVT
jgi:hypothetical protein